MSSTVQTLKQLKNMELQGTKRLDLSEGLTTFPDEIYKLADSLEVLDLSNNKLTDLPDDLHRLKKLKILFCSNNLFTHLPDSIGRCESLEMIGFKSNQIKTVSDNSLPDQTRWLILTDNKIESLPENFGKLTRLRKLALAGNALTHLPESIKECVNLELIRISANNLSSFPDVLMQLPKLAWLAFSGNPFCAKRDQHVNFKTVKFSELELLNVLGQGASGVISKAYWNNNKFNFSKYVAVKVFKGEVTSDGYPEDELDACLAIGEHNNLVKSVAKITESHQSALVMDLIPEDYINLGQPPSLETCTRDTFTNGQSFSISQIEKIIIQMKSLVAHFLEKNISHGDLYAHNVLINKDQHILFGDFGAASKYHNLNDSQKDAIAKIENRAFKYFVEDMLSLCHAEDKNSKLFQQLNTL